MVIKLPQEPSVKDLIDALQQLPADAELAVVVPEINGFRLNAVRAMVIPNKLGVDKHLAGTRSVVILETIRS